MTFWTTTRWRDRWCEEKVIIANFSPSRLDFIIIMVVCNIDQLYVCVYLLLLRNVPVLGQHEWTAGRCGWMDGSAGCLNVNWTELSLLFSFLHPGSTTQLVGSQQRTYIDYGNVMKCAKTLKSPWRQLIYCCVSSSSLYHRHHRISLASSLSIRTKKGNFQLVLVSFKSSGLQSTPYDTKQPTPPHRFCFSFHPYYQPFPLPRWVHP